MQVRTKGINAGNLFQAEQVIGDGKSLTERQIGGLNTFTSR